MVAGLVVEDNELSDGELESYQAKVEEYTDKIYKDLRKTLEFTRGELQTRSSILQTSDTERLV